MRLLLSVYVNRGMTGRNQILDFPRDHHHEDKGYQQFHESPFFFSGPLKIFLWRNYYFTQSQYQWITKKLHSILDKQMPDRLVPSGPHKLDDLVCEPVSHQ